jgi:proteasome lid subunit RPN8/RPN11
MTPSRIRVTPRENPTPQAASLPLENAWHWVSPYEGNGNEAAILVFLTRTVFHQVALHASSDPEIEVGGVLVGKWCIDPETARQYIVVTACLPAQFTQQGSVFLTFTRDSLVDIHAKLDEKYPEDVIVGWYHTHPYMGVFLSQYDTWLHEHFFPEPWQVALVIEPHSESGGFFIRPARGPLDAIQYYGFYELDDNNGLNVLHWTNLELRSAEPENQGANQHE